MREPPRPEPPSRAGDPRSTPGLPARLAARHAHLGAPFRERIEAALAQLRRSALSAGARHGGDRAPDFALSDRRGNPKSLSMLLRLGPVVLSFHRGEWCTFCQLELDALIEAQPRIAALGAHVLMVSPQDPSEALLSRTRDVAGLTLLHDPSNGVGLLYGLIFRMPDALRQALLAAGMDLGHVYGTDSWLLPMPATYLIRQDGTIALAHVDPDFTRRLDPEALVARLGGRPSFGRLWPAGPGGGAR